MRVGVTPTISPLVILLLKRNYLDGVGRFSTWIVLLLCVFVHAYQLEANRSNYFQSYATAFNPSAWLDLKTCKPSILKTLSNPSTKSVLPCKRFI